MASPSASVAAPVKTNVREVLIWEKLIVGAIAGVTGTTLIYPMDTMKTRLMNQKAAADGKLPYSGVVDCGKKILAREGVRGFYKGLWANLLGVTPEKAIKLAAHDHGRKMLRERHPETELSIPEELLAGAFAGLTQSVATTPMEIAKMFMQTQAERGVHLTTIETVQMLGLRGLYRGIDATLVRDIPFSMIFFPMYVYLRKWLVPDPDNAGVLETLAAGGLAACVASAVVTPADVVKTRRQGPQHASYPSTIGAFSKIHAEEGMQALWRGWQLRMATTGPLFAISMLAFQAQKMYLEGRFSGGEQR